MNDGSVTESGGSSGPERGALAALLEAPDPARPAIHHGASTVSFGELRARVDELAAELRRSPATGPLSLGIVLPGSVDAIAALFAAWAVGGIAAPVNPRLTPTEQDTLLHRAGATLRLDPTGLHPIPAEPTARPTARAGATEDVALVLTTSGTTGTPKPVELRHGNVLEGIDTVLGALRGPGTPPGPDPTRAPVPNLVPVPLSLWAGTYQVLFAFRAGNPVVVLDPFTTTSFAAAVAAHAIRSTVLAPAMMAALNDDPAITALTPLKMIRSITAPLSVHQARRFHDRFGVTVLNSYGQTELGGEVIGWTAADTRAHGVAKLGAVGRPHPGVRARIHEPDDEGTGELAVRAPSMATPEQAPELDDRRTPDGFLRTGDVARIDADGFVWLTGRVSDLINRGGLKVWPDDVEEVLRRHPAVADVAVVGAPDDRLGQVPWAFVVLAPDLPRAELPTPGAPTPGAASGPMPDDGLVDLPRAAELDAHARQSLAAYKVPVRYVEMSDLPRSDVGKVLRRQLVDRITAP